MSPDSSPVPSSSSSHVALSAAGDGDEYSEEELQFVWDTVVRAEAILPKLPPTSRHPTTALFRAYGDLLEERHVEPLNGAKLDVLLFKIGGSHDGNTIAERFQAVLAKMNITVRLDIDDITDDDFSSHSDMSYPSDHEDEYYPPGPPDHHLPQLKYRDRPEQLERLDLPDHQNHEDVDHEDIKEKALDKNAASFEQYRDKIHSLQSLEQWQDRAYHLEARAALFLEAQIEDKKMDKHDVFVAWNEIAVEIDEMPLDDLPANVYSKRIERIATRTHEIKVSKNLLVGWRQRAQARHRQQNDEQRQKDEEHSRQMVEDELFKDDPKFVRLAQRTHENLCKSRVLAQWSNRAAEEEEKAEIAKKAHEMSLKAKAFGLRPKPELFASLRQRLQEKVTNTNQANAPMGEPQRMHEPEPFPIRPATVEEPKNLDAATPAGNAVQEDQKLAGPQGDNSNDDDSLADELDERTLLAKRHLTRMKFFRAWEQYTSKHTLRVEAFATRKALEPWYEKSCQLIAVTQEGAEEHIQRRDRHLLAQWRGPDERQEKLEAMASDFYRKRRLGNALAGWRAAENQAGVEAQEFDHMSNLADQYRRTHGTLRAWKARSREVSVKTSMKRDALQIWRQDSAEDRNRNQQLEYMAGRVDLYRIKEKFLPPWRGAARAQAAREQQLRTWSERADFYSLTTQAIQTWRATAKAKRRSRLRGTYLEMRRRVKKAMGAQCIAKWHGTSESRRHHLSAASEEFAQYRDWNDKVWALTTWRLRALEKAEVDVVRSVEAYQQHLWTWREQADDRQQLQFEMEDHFQEKTISRAVKEWKIGSLQLESRRNASERHLNRQRKQLKQSFEIWCTKAINKAQRFTPAAEEEQEPEPEPEQRPEPQAQEQEEAGFISTPARPRLFMGPLAQTTTPLGPIPQRQPWSGSVVVPGPKDSLLERPLIGGTASRSGRPRRNLRVSWADRG